MKKLAFIFVVLVVAGLTPAGSLDFDGLYFGGIVQADYYGLVDSSTFYTNERVRLTLAPELAWKNDSGFLDLHLGGYFFFQALGDPQWIEPSRLLREAYLGLHFPVFDLYLGQKFVTWGMVDLLSPLNVVNHSDSTTLSIDSTLESSLADLLAQLQLHISDSLRLEVVYVPFLQPNIYPIEEVHVQSILTVPMIPKKQIYDFDASFINVEVPLFSEWAHSVHLAGHYTSYLFDLIVAYSFYVDQMLDFDLSEVYEQITDEGPPAADRHTVTGTAYPTYNRVHNVGVGVSFYVRNLLISADGSLKITQDWEGTRMETRNSELFYTVQMERMFWNRLRVQANFFHRYVINADAELKSSYSSVVESIINFTIDDYLFQIPASQLYFLAHLDGHFLREKLIFAATAVYGNSEKAFYIIPRIAYRVNDYMSISVGADIWLRHKHAIYPGYLSLNEENDNFFVRLQLSL